MSIWLHPRNKALPKFSIGTACWGYILDHAGLLWPVAFNGARWFVVSGVDRRFEVGKDGSLYPDILGDSGHTFRVYADEARVLARVARNLTVIQSVLPADQTTGVGTGDFLKPAHEQVWPRKIRDDWPPIWTEFAEWADQSRGFTKGG